MIGEVPSMEKPRRGGIPVEQLIEQGRARGVDPDYQAWNTAAPPVPYDDAPPLAWLADATRRAGERA